MSSDRWNSTLYLESGESFEGTGFGYRGEGGGEVVFNTGLSGYQEVATDPSYSRQILVFTAPHIGNTGINSQDMEADAPNMAGVIVRELCRHPSSWRSEQSFESYLAERRVPGISGIDTRELTRVLRESGAQRGVMVPWKNGVAPDERELKTQLKKIPPMEGQGLVDEVSTVQPYRFGESWNRSDAPSVIVYDYGVKRGILRSLDRRGFAVTVVPYRFPAAEVLKLKPRALILSNGPGDPGEVEDAPEILSALIGKVPMLAICMGHQLLARALGGATFKLKFGHHGLNHPVRCGSDGRILVTSQNHGFAVEAGSLPSNVQVSHISLNDGTVEGFRSDADRLHSVQFHPEAAPGPNDAQSVFSEFFETIQ